LTDWKLLQVKNRLILPNKQESEPSKQGVSDKISLFYKLFSRKFVFLFGAFIFLFFFTPAYAGVLTVFGGLFGQSINSVSSSTNSQNMALLKADLVLNPKDAQGGGGTKIVGGTALMAENGPGGLSLETPQSNRIDVHVVREGESLSGIADLYNVSPNTIRWANDIGRNDTILIGQVLVILPISGVRYEAKTGDTLASIAKEFKGDLNEIALFNGLDPNSGLVSGAEIIIPRGELAPPPPPPASSSSPTRTNVASGGSRNDPSGYYIRPISGGLRTQGIHGLNAVDLASYEGANVYASAAGRVIVNRPSGWNGGYGNYIVIQHDNGSQTLYSHLSRNLVSQGQMVSQGQVIGLIGNTGLSTGPHLHFEIRNGPTNPF